MTDWQDQIEAALDACAGAFALAGYPGIRELLSVEYLPAPHRPTPLVPGRIAIYGFWWQGRWLKIGKVGHKSGPRFASHHYHTSASSTLAKSLVKELSTELPGLDPADPGAWICRNVSRVNITLPATVSPLHLSFLEAFLHLRLRPRYEG